MKNAISFLLLLTLSSCHTATSDTIENEITYIKDMRTGLCFASISSPSYMGYYVRSITCVPCDSLQSDLKNFDMDDF